jgi:anti-sigma regulatory factor (Ser/Thr protein kinase)
MPSLTVPANLEQLSQVKEYIHTQVPKDYTSVLDHILLAAEELLVNVFTHAYQEGQGQAELHCRVVVHNKKEYLCLTVKDWGPYFNPFSNAPDPNVDLNIEDRPIGGLGIYLIKAITAHTEYKRLEDTNIVDLYFEKKI